MKVLYITPGCFDKGGISRYNRYQIQALREIYGKDQVRVLSLLGPLPDGFEEKIEVHWHGNNNFLRSKLEFVWQMWHALFFWKADFIHVAHVNFSGITTILGKIFRRKVLLNVYGLEVWSVLSRDAAYGLGHVDFIISDCHNTANYIEQNIKPHPEISVIWDCVDLEKFTYSKAGFQDIQQRYHLPDRQENFIILTLGRMSPDTAYKGYSRLLDVLAIVIRQVENACLIYAGSGNLIVELKEKAKSLGLQNKVYFTGSVLEQDLPGIYSYCHMFSLVTQSGKDMGEGIPLTPLEAMACGKPILVGNQDGSREAVFDDQNGFIVEPSNLQDHAERIIRLGKDESLLQSMSESAVSIATTHFNYGTFKEAHRKLYQQWELHT